MVRARQENEQEQVTYRTSQLDTHKKMKKRNI